MQQYQAWGRATNTVEWDGSVTKGAVLPTTSSGRNQGVVKRVNHEKGFGFITYGNKNIKDVFFHFNNVPQGVMLKQGDELSFPVEKDSKNGKLLPVTLKRSNHHHHNYR
jgi:cold shock CspA family protein